MAKTSTRQCPKCGSRRLARMGTINRKYCPVWELELEQSPIYGGVLPLDSRKRKGA